MIDLAHFWMGRDEAYPLQLTPDLRRNAALTVDLANQVLAKAAAYGVPLELHPVSKSIVTSGWRPPALNAATPGAATKSRHMTCQAIDLYDPEGAIDDWLMSPAGQLALHDLGLWMEHPSATKGWAHLQTVPPRSGNLVFYP